MVLWSTATNGHANSALACCWCVPILLTSSCINFVWSANAFWTSWLCRLFAFIQCIFRFSTKMMYAWHIASLISTGSCLLLACTLNTEIHKIRLYDTLTQASPKMPCISLVLCVVIRLCSLMMMRGGGVEGGKEGELCCWWLLVIGVLCGSVGLKFSVVWFLSWLGFSVQESSHDKQGKHVYWCVLCMYVCVAGVISNYVGGRVFSVPLVNIWVSFFRGEKSLNG